MSDATMSTAALAAMPIHWYADRFPYISDDESLELAQDIEANGLMHPIVLFNEEILDGRNRLKALAKTNLTKVAVEYYDGTDPVGYIISLNLLRRHLTTGQRAFLALDLVEYEAAEAEKRMRAGVATDPTLNCAEGEATERAGDRLNVSRESVKRARILSLGVTDAAKEAAEKVRSGVWTLNQGVEHVKPKAVKAPQPEMGSTGSDTGWGREEPSSYDEQRATAIEVLVRQAVLLGEKISRYAVVDGDVVDMPGLPGEFGPTARQLADLFGDVAAALGS